MKKIVYLSSLFLFLLTSVPSLAHSGRTNDSGCHTERKTGQTHCH
jgi:hypothetical protein